MQVEFWLDSLELGGFWFVMRPVRSTTARISDSAVIVQIVCRDKNRRLVVW